ncbi:MAG: carbamoyltransferase HypF [Chloroflexi bacterium]|nr:carbamoyltransferase HypF [Chloroflexota bacterium]
MSERWRLHVQGIVQGVGFRPFVYGLALRYELGGHVGNNGDGVFIEVEGAAAALQQFHAALTAELPPLAHIDALTVTALPLLHETEFSIRASQSSDRVSAHIPADVGVCDACLRELYDSADRRYRYPFINCTHCGPRFTIIQALPYDRATTTMSIFPMCPECAAEYHDPLSRRFHAQPVACPVCGPRIWLQAKNGDSVRGTEATLTAVSELLRAGQIAAIKGLGGCHLACDATNDAALALLRERKARVDKPFAVMVRDLEMARHIAHISDEEAALLVSRQRPIVLVKQCADSPLSAGVAPGNPYVGLLLPYTPLHYLLLDALPDPLVMTSGNLSGEPIAIDNAEALERLAPLVDAWLLHDRPIHTPCDDSVLRVFEGGELPIRRSRGYTPFAIKLPFAAESVLATGGELKNTFCLTHDGYAFLSQHIGDMENLETLTAFEQAQAHLRALYRAEPRALVCDLHPNYLTTQWAQRVAAQTGLPLIQVQHHHAHMAAVLAEHSHDGAQTVIGVCLDGTGYGTDGTIWGGEVLIADYADFRRAAYLKPVPLPGGDAAVKFPYRMALAQLWAAGIEWHDDLPPVTACPPAERNILRRQFETGFQTVLTSSMGRLFDAVAALIGVRQRVTYEAQAAIELEGLAGDDAQPYALAIVPDAGGALVLDPAPLITQIAADVLAGVPVSRIAAGFHSAVAEAVIAVCDRLRADGHGSTVALSGGVFQNVRLLDALVRGLREHGFTVLVQRQVPSNDGGLALGQAALGAWRLQQNRLK